MTRRSSLAGERFTGGREERPQGVDVHRLGEVPIEARLGRVRLVFLLSQS